MDFLINKNDWEGKVSVLYVNKEEQEKAQLDWNSYYWKNKAISCLFTPSIDTFNEPVTSNLFKWGKHYYSHSHF